MRFVAYLRGVPDLPRPVQTFGMSLATVSTWADMILGKQTEPDAYVEIFERVEQLRARISKPKLVEKAG